MNNGTSENFRNDTAEALRGGGKGARLGKRDTVFPYATDEPSHLASSNSKPQFEFKVKPTKEDELIVKRDALFILNALGINQDGSPLATQENISTRVPQHQRSKHGEGSPIPLEGRMLFNKDAPAEFVSR